MYEPVPIYDLKIKYKAFVILEHIAGVAVFHCYRVVPIGQSAAR